MTPTIQIRASQADVEKDRALLRSDWNKDTLDAVLAFLWGLVPASANTTEHEWQKVLAFDTGKLAGKDLNPHILRCVRGLAQALAEPALPPMPAAFSAGRGTRSIAQAEKTWAYLMLPALATLTGDTELFHDAQSLLFLCALHYLLPQLAHQKLAPEHACLVNALYVHTLLAWRGQPAHLFYLQSSLMDHLGNTARRLELLDLSLQLTPVEDHSYLTKATSYWADLLDQGDRNAALSFLLDLSKRCPPSYEAEIKDMLVETLAPQAS